MNPESALRNVRIWDLPTRLFHWSLALVVIVSVVTGQVGGNAMVWHTRLGLVVMALLLFRLVWGFAGGYWSRFASFLYGPRSMMAYLRGESGPGGRYDIGHSPIGALSVWALLGLLVVQVVTGLVADDEIATTGPLNRFVAGAKALQATAWHKGPGQWILIALVALHVAAIVAYRVRGKHLVPAMIHGDKSLPAAAPAAADGIATRLLALAVAAACGAVAVWIARLGG